ncbi:hypothetical protein CAPTEDRAFT_176475 [Capitella teleta]|uniref:Conserved oligomeric Golgi complex subunit 3 n=1 Tax=Capitella teleta TaxID=283909 RepID=R7V6T4_CAPTE|nr:hypothetical protein CAPTEDRAFT_176475 [Capitella teleta]|eukprot:ELU14157.1 hypothetical protein CAPTEDRAFT_176475 [Capitella teleta]
MQPQQAPKNFREKLSAWDATVDPKAPLTDRQKDSFMELTTHSSNRPLPVELPLDDEVLSLATRGLPATPSEVEEDVLTKAFSSKYERLDTAQQFFLWFSEVEAEMEEEADFPQRELLERLQDYRGECELVTEQLDIALDHLTDLRQRYVHVSTKTNTLHEACENALEEQTRLVNTADSINNKLTYFNELDRISSKLGSPTLTVTSESFIPMLSRLDECINYINKNPQFKESSIYLAKFRQCLSRALSFIKIHVFSVLQSATQHVLPKKVPGPTDDAFTLFYGKFRANAPRVKSLMEEVESRLDKSPEYQQLLSDCHTCFFQQRQTLLGPSVQTAIYELATKHERDHCALVRSGCAFMVHVCEDEHQLFFHFFTKTTPALDATLESLCNSLYDVLRPLIIHVNHLETLAELCSILKIEMIEEHVQNSPEQLKAFEVVCSQMLEDVQERLVYRSHIYIRQEILNYKPAEGDLAYPEKLQMMESIAASIRKDREEQLSRHNSETSLANGNHVDNMRASLDRSMSLRGDDVFFTVPLSEPGHNMPMSPADLHGMWYPTVRRTLVCLSKLFRCIDRSTFQGLSQEVLSMCIHSLVSASDSIKKKKSAIDGDLFLIKHLLILREQIAPFHVDFAVRETSLDFSKIKDAARDLLQSRSRLFAMNSQNSLLQFVLDGTPQVTETFHDSKKDVDHQLKATCEEFIKHVVHLLVGPLQDFLNKADVILRISRVDGDDGPAVSLRLQPFASPEQLHSVVAQTYRGLKQHKGLVQKSMALYLANKDTEYILFKPIKTHVQQNFQQLQALLSEHYSEEDQQIVGAPTLEQINLLLATSTAKQRTFSSSTESPPRDITPSSSS